METYNQFSAQQGQPECFTIFIGCLDPRTSKDDVVAYFKLFDHDVNAKLIVNFKTGQSKQCALLFCSCNEACQEILKHDHYLHERRLRLNYAQDEFKGKKADHLVPVQISGLDPTTILEELTEYFGQVNGFKRARLIQGLHPKQKKVAVLYFSDSQTAQDLLNQSHLKIGKRNCKVAEYSKDRPLIGHSSVTSTKSEKDLKKQLFSYNSQGVQPKQGSPALSFSSGHQTISSIGTPSFSVTSPETDEPRRLKPLKLNSGMYLPKVSQLASGHSSKKQENAFVHPVEVEEDDLFRIFCDSENCQDFGAMLQVPQQGKKITESNETAAE